MRDGDYLNKPISPDSNWFRSHVQGTTYSTIGPIPADRPDAPERIEWRGFVLLRRPVVHYGDFLSWWNQGSVGQFWIGVDGGQARITLDNEEGHCLEAFAGYGETPEAALESARGLLLARLREWALLFGAVFYE